MNNSERQVSIDSFINGHVQFLATTNALGRAVDGENVMFVINYDIPESKGLIDAKAYLHRVGRCGRFGKNIFYSILCFRSYYNVFIHIIHF